MKTVIRQLRDFTCRQNKAYIISLLILGSISVYCNYTYRLEDAIDHMDNPTAYFGYAAMYAVHFFVAYLLHSLFHKDFAFWKKPVFWILLISGPLIFALRSSSVWHFQWIYNFSETDNDMLNGYLYNDLFRGAYLIIPVVIMWLIFDRKRQPLYGVSDKNHNYKLYWLLLLCMVPLIAAASTQGDFLSYYPKLRHITQSDPNASLGTKLLYELIYGTDFISIELFFRGFLVMAFIRYVGEAAILPMAFFYLSIHYGKPMGEAISSFFGGTILGVIAFHSRSIYGGIMVHVGIAWLMELGGIIGNAIKNN